MVISVTTGKLPLLPWPHEPRAKHIRTSRYFKSFFITILGLTQIHCILKGDRIPFQSKSLILRGFKLEYFKHLMSSTSHQERTQPLLTASRSRELIRVCQPGPVALNASKISASTRMFSVGRFTATGGQPLPLVIDGLLLSLCLSSGFVRRCAGRLGNGKADPSCPAPLACRSNQTFGFHGSQYQPHHVTADAGAGFFNFRNRKR